MATPIERMTDAWRREERASALPQITADLAAEGVPQRDIENALAQLLRQAADEGVDESTEDIILSLGDRLHGKGWCPPEDEIVVRDNQNSNSPVVRPTPSIPQPSATH
jgi:hypothetical protein